MYLNSWIAFLFCYPCLSFHIIGDLSFHIIDVYLNSWIVFFCLSFLAHLTAMLRPCSSSFLWLCVYQDSTKRFPSCMWQCLVCSENVICPSFFLHSGRNIGAWWNRGLQGNNIYYNDVNFLAYLEWFLHFMVYCFFKGKHHKSHLTHIMLAWIVQEKT